MEDILLNHALNLATEIPSTTDIHCRKLSKSDVDEGYYQSIGSLGAEISFFSNVCKVRFTSFM